MRYKKIEGIGFLALLGVWGAISLGSSELWIRTLAGVGLALQVAMVSICRSRRAKGSAPESWRLRGEDGRDKNEALKTLGELSATLVHEINNPVTNIKGYCYQISEALKDPPEQMISIVKHANERIHYNTDRIAAISKSVRSWVLGGQGQSDTETVELVSLLNECVELSLEAFKKSNVSIELQANQSACVVKGRRLDLTQIVLNLLSNAREACESSRQQTVRLSLVLGSERCEVLVEDSGTGVPAEISKRIFDPFFSTKEQSGGSGLGLFLVRRLVEKNHGQIRFENLSTGNSIVGARFVVSFLRAEASMSSRAA